jgi:hypothetical protein
MHALDAGVPLRLGFTADKRPPAVRSQYNVGLPICLRCFMKSLVAILVVALSCAYASAQEAPKNPCKPPVMPNDQSSDIVVKYFNKHWKEYEACVNKFVTEQRDIANNTTNETTKRQQAWDAAEAAQKEHNSMVDALNAHKAAQDKDDDAK